MRNEGRFFVLQKIFYVFEYTKSDWKDNFQSLNNYSNTYTRQGLLPNCIHSDLVL